MILSELTPEKIAEMKRVYEAYRPLLHPNRRSGAEVDNMEEIIPWLIIIAALATFAIVNAQEKTNENSKNSKSYRFVKGLCVTLSTGAFMYIVLKWELWICIGCGILLGIGGFHLGVKSNEPKEK